MLESDHKLTRAEMAQMLYNLLSNRSAMPNDVAAEISAVKT